MESMVVDQRSSQHNNSEEEDEEEINIYVKVIKTISISVKASDTVRNVKETLNDKEGISECLQELFFTGDWLHDGKKLIDCGIGPNSTLHLFVQNSGTMRLNIKIPSDKRIIVVEAKIHDTIQNIKSLIQVKEGVYSDNFNLLYAGHLLQDDKTLASLNIKGESTLHMVLTPRDVLLISLKMPTGEILKAEVKILYTVCDVKTVVESMVGFPIDDLSLTYGGVQLEDSKTLYSYNITEESILEMSPQTFQVFIKNGSGKTITLDVCLKDLVKSVKDKIFHKLGIPSRFQSLVFEGKSLDDGRYLSCYNIRRNSTLCLVFWPSTLVQPKKLSELVPFQKTSMKLHNHF